VCAIVVPAVVPAVVVSSGPVCAIVVPAVVVSSGPVCAGIIAVPKSSCCAGRGAVVAVVAVAAVAAVAAAGAVVQARGWLPAGN